MLDFPQILPAVPAPLSIQKGFRGMGRNLIRRYRLVHNIVGNCYKSAHFGKENGPGKAKAREGACFPPPPAPLPARAASRASQLVRRSRVATCQALARLPECSSGPTSAPSQSTSKQNRGSPRKVEAKRIAGFQSRRGKCKRAN